MPVSTTDNTKSSAGNVAFVRKEVVEAMPDWAKVEDCVKGQRRIKMRGDAYLPRPMASDTSDDNLARYENYKERAVYHNYTGRTLKGLVGQVFSRESEIEVGTALENVQADAQGDGVSAEQQAKRALRFVMKCGRSGLLTDYPVTDGPTTRAQLDSGEIRPTLKLYNPVDIINWSTKTVGAKVFYTLLVLVEYEDSNVDEFETEVEKRYRVLRLDKETGNYTVQMYRDIDGKNNSGQESVGDLLEPRDSAGQPLKEIPFSFIGADNNDHILDDAPMLDIADLNVAHYRNSADHEESTFVVGQPTLWCSGITKEWNDDVLQGAINFGALGGLSLPKDGQAGILQADPNTMAMEGMLHKEKQMVALGAKLIEENQKEKTATEATQDEAAELSVLGSAAKNVSAAYTKAFEWAQVFVGSSGIIKFELNSDFDLAKMTPGERAQTIAEWQAEATSRTEMRHALKRGGVAYQADQEYRDEIDRDPPITIPDDMVDEDDNKTGDDNE